MEEVQAEVEKELALVRIEPKPKSRGVWLEMADGQEWMVPFLLVGPRGAEILKKITELDKVKEDIDKTIEQAKADGKTEEETAKMLAEKVDTAQTHQYNFELCSMIMALNYPTVPSEQFEDIFDVVCAAEVVSICSGVRRE